jgi:methyl-accepting chemotaxis protein
MIRKTEPNLLRRLNPLSSIRGKVTFILLSLAALAGTAGYFTYQSFDFVSRSVQEMTNRDLPQLEQSNALITAAGKTKDAMISVLIAEDAAALDSAAAEVDSAASGLQSEIGELPEDMRGSFEQEMARVAETLNTAISARSNAFENSARVKVMTQELQALVSDTQSLLLQLADDAYFNISVKGDDTMSMVDETLLDLAENKFAILQALLEIRAEINLMSGITLAMATETDRSMLSILGDLAASSYDRLQVSMSGIEGTDVGSMIGEDLVVVAETMLTAINAGTSGAAFDQASILSSRQEADALLASAVDDMVFELTIAADDAATGNRDAIQSLLDNEVDFMNTLLEINSRLSAYQVEGLKIVGAQTVEQVQSAEKAMLGAATGLAKYLEFSDGILAEQITSAAALAAPETGLASFRMKSLRAQQNAAAAVQASVEAVLMIAGKASVRGAESQSMIYEKAVSISDDAAEVKGNLELVGVGAAALVLLTLGLSHLLIVRPLNGISRTTERLSQGDMSPVTGFDRSSDEIVRIARALTVFRDGLVEKEELERIAENERAENQAKQAAAVDAIGRGLSELAQGNLVYRIDAELAEGYQQLKADFNRTAETLKGTVEEVSDVAGSIRRGSSEISQAADDLSHRTESQAATLEETAAALEQLTVSVRSSADGTKEAEATTLDARNKASESGVVVEKAVKAMKDIEASSSQISQIIGVIDDISFQTNLLALNAGVEAARAGEAGRGFAVVASEVRGLSQRTTDAAREIKELISTSTGQVEAGVDLVSRTGDALQSIVERVAAISSLVSGIAASTDEQATGLTETNTAVSLLDQVTQQNAAMVEETSAAGQLLSSDAQRLSDLMAKFNTTSMGMSQEQAAIPDHGDGSEVRMAS